ncbi:MAG: TetR/AcrR family transcriptional regulator [Acidimicrobiales bacterium]
MSEVEPTPTGYPKKRARTRQRLLRAGLEALGSSGPDGLTVGQLSVLAGTSQGTFYNHFGSIPELVAEAADHLGQGVEIATDALEAVEHDPAARVAIGTLQLLRLAEDDRVASAAFVTLAAVLPDFRARVRSVVRRAIEDGVRAGRFTVEPGEAPVNAVLGTSLQSMRSRTLGESVSSEQTAVASLILRALGLDPGEIPTVVERAAQIVAADPWRPLAA